MSSMNKMIRPLIERMPRPFFLKNAVGKCQNSCGRRGNEEKEKEELFFRRIRQPLLKLQKLLIFTEFSHLK